MNKRVRNFIVCVGLLACSANLFGMKRRGTNDTVANGMSNIFYEFLSTGELSCKKKHVLSIISPNRRVLDASSIRICALALVIRLGNLPFVTHSDRAEVLSRAIETVTKQNNEKHQATIKKFLKKTKENTSKKNKKNRGSSKKQYQQKLSGFYKKCENRKKKSKAINLLEYFGPIAAEELLKRREAIKQEKRNSARLDVRVASPVIYDSGEMWGKN